MPYCNFFSRKKPYCFSYFFHFELRGYMTLLGLSVSEPTDPEPSLPEPTLPGPSVYGSLKLVECNQHKKNKELTIQHMWIQENNQLGIYFSI